MGSRASYVLVEDGAIAVYYSHWGATSVPRVAIGGPEETRAYLRGLESVKGLLDTTWAEGGILVDSDTQTLLFWGGTHLASRAYLRRLFVPVVRQIWRGWSVSWAMRGTLDFADHPGVARALQLDPADLVDRGVGVAWQPYAEVEIREPQEPPWIGAVITVKWEDGRVADYTFCRYPHGYLTYGEALLALVRGREPGTPPREDGDGDRERIPIGGAYVDAPHHILWVWDEESHNPQYVEAIARAWPDWRVMTHADGLASQIALSGRDPSLVTVPQEQVVTELLEEVVGDDGFDPRQIARMIGAHSDPATTTFAPGFFRLDTPPAPTPDRLALLLWAIPQALSESSGPSELPELPDATS